MNPQNNKTLDKVQNCIIDKEGIFKYVQLNLTDHNTKEEKIVVRGYKGCEYHRDIYDEFLSKNKNIKYIFNPQ